LLKDPFEEVWKGFYRPVRWTPETEVTMKVDVEEDEKAYTIKAEIPGVKKEDISVSVDGNVVTIQAETKREKDVREGNKLLRSERYYGTLYRSFSMPMDVDEGKAEAKYAEGVLLLTLPKKASAKAHTLAIR
jgi:HSP20 family protein